MWVTLWSVWVILGSRSGLHLGHALVRVGYTWVTLWSVWVTCGSRSGLCGLHLGHALGHIIAVFRRAQAQIERYLNISI
jgi:hypothetical protein